MGKSGGKTTIGLNCTNLLKYCPWGILLVACSEQNVSINVLLLVPVVQLDGVAIVLQCNFFKEHGTYDLSSRVLLLALQVLVLPHLYIPFSVQ
jgi:Zn-dependent protease